MRITSESKLQIGGIAALLVLGASLFPVRVFAQIPSPGAATPGTRANLSPLPLNGQSGSVKATQAPIPGATTSVNTINSTVQSQGSYTGSTRGPAFSGKLSLRDAIERALKYNLSAAGMNQAVRQAQGQSRVARSALLPSVNGVLSETVQQVNLKALGVRFNSPIPGLALPTVVGPFNYIDLRASLSQSVMDLTAWNNYRAANETLRANRLSAQDAGDLIVLAVGGAYLQVIAAEARVQSARAQLATANSLYQQTLQNRLVGLLAQVDVDRSQIEALSQQQRLTSLESDVAKQKINLARMIGLPPNYEYQLSGDPPFSAAPPLSLDETLQQAFEQRPDLKAAETQVRAAERTLSAARAERYPSLAVNGNYGAIGTNPSQAHSTFAAVATLNLPIWQGGRTEGDIEQAAAALAQRRAELENLKSQIEADVRSAHLDLGTSSRQVEVARKNVQITKESLDLTRQRFDAGVSDNVEVVRAQESVANADLDYINSVFAYNVAKLSLARAMGHAQERLAAFFKLP